MSLGQKDTSETLGVLQLKGDQYTKAAVIERKRLTELEDALHHISGEIEKYRSRAKASAIDVMNLHILTPNPAYSRADGVDVAKQAQQVTHKVLNVLEMKLNKLLQRKSEVNNQNKHIKGEIDHMRRLRLQTDDSHAKFEAALSSIKENVEGILGESSLIVEQREKIMEKKEALERVNREEQRAFEEEYEELGRFIKEQNAALEASLLKERKADGLVDDATNTGGPLNGGQSLMSTDGNSTVYSGNHDLTLEQEVEMARKVGSLSNFVANEQNSLTTIQNTIHGYEQMFDQLKRLTNTSSLRDVASAYSAQEEEMFSLYNYIQTVNSDIEVYAEDQLRVQEQIEKYKNIQSVEEQHRGKILEDLQQRLQTTVDATQKCVEKNLVHQECVEQLSKKVQSVFYKLQCDQMDSTAKQAQTSGAGGVAGGKSKGNATSTSSNRVESKIALLTGQSVAENNVLEYMGAIEQRAVDVISEYLYSKHCAAAMEGTGRHPTPGPSSPMKTMGNTTANPQTLNSFPTADLLADLSDDDALAESTDEQDNKPVDLQNYKDKLFKKMSVGRENGGTLTGRNSHRDRRQPGTPSARQDY